MNEHYYSQRPSVQHDEKIIDATFFGRTFQFKTDAGVFSKNRIDFGTTALIDTIHYPRSAKILDLGCGYGPVGIVSASVLAEGQVQMVDVNERAVELAKYNILHNQKVLNERVAINVFQSNGFEKVLDRDFDLILLNPPIRAGKILVYQLFEESYLHLKNNGQLWIVIQKKQGAASAMKKLESLFQRVEEVDKLKGYSIFQVTKKCKNENFKP
ncbi:methyltransferase [Tepidibacillus marianensis]|uniref:class I SAM-dependent methyltransferase n=1 Tax=Tepidibacillus marianensis TaxID=3131995 RepID=UPI0030D2C5EE